MILAGMMASNRAAAPGPPETAYVVADAVAAAAADDGTYFDTVLPSSAGDIGPFTSPPTPPRLRAAFAAQTVFPSFTAVDHGSSLASELTTANGYTLEGTVSDSGGRGWVNPAPDGSAGCIELRYTAGQAAAQVRFFLRDFGSTPLKQAGLSVKAWWQAGFDWGNPASNVTTGWLGPGLYVGAADTAIESKAPETQLGTPTRSSWSNGISAAPDQFAARAYLDSYEFNRRMARSPSTRMPARSTGDVGSSAEDWTVGSWVDLDFEIVMNDAGQANGLIRMWIGSALKAEVRDAVLTLDGSVGVSGFYMSDAWLTGTSPATQKVWLKEARYWRLASEVTVPSVPPILQPPTTPGAPP